MPRLFGRLLAFGLAAGVVVCAAGAAPRGPLAFGQDRPVTFARDVAPIIFDRCRQHSPQQPVRLGNDRLGDTLV